MSRVIEKKIWPEFFDKVQRGEKNFELRLADFDLEEGDVIKFREWDPETKDYTGREFEKKVKNVVKFSNLTKFHKIEELEKFGFYVIELEI